MIPAIVNLIIWIVILGVLYAIAVYAIDNLLPDPPARIIKVVLIVILGLVAVLLLLDLVGIGTGMNMPKLTS
jgi:hypothetical protein